MTVIAPASDGSHTSKAGVIGAPSAGGAQRQYVHGPAPTRKRHPNDRGAHSVGARGVAWYSTLAQLPSMSGLLLSRWAL